MLKKIVLALALLFGALAATQVPSQAAPLGGTAQAQTAVPSSVEKAQYYYYRRRFGPRYYRPRYYRPRYFYRPRYYRRSFFY